MYRLHRPSRLLPCVLAALALVTLAGSAAAENGHAYNGSYCNAYFGSQAANFYHQYNGTYNASTAGTYISCPVLVDEIANTTGTTQVWVHWTANAAADTISCYLFSMNGNGTIRQSQGAGKAGSGWFGISNLTTDDYWGSYSMYCYLPRYGNINTIWLGEKD
jgi:hypothetical protein